MKIDRTYLKIQVSILMLCFLPLVIGWFLAPLIAENNLVRYILIFVSLMNPLIYFLMKFILKVESTLISDIALFMVSMLFIMPFSFAYYKIPITNINLLFLAAFLLNGSSSFLIIYKKMSISVYDLNETILKYLPFLPLYAGAMLLFKTLTNTITPSFSDLSVERKVFLIFRISYFFILFGIILSLKKKFNEQNKKVSFELNSLIFFLCFYLVSSFYLFNNHDFLNGDYYSYTAQIAKYLGITTISIISIILLLNPVNNSDKFHKIYLVVIFIYGFMVFLPVMLDLLKDYIPDFSKTLFNKQESFLAAVISMILGSLISGLLLKILIKKKTKKPLGAKPHLK